jgi:hypothetical protein
VVSGGDLRWPVLRNAFDRRIRSLDGGIDVVLKADGEIIASGLFWHLRSRAVDVRRLVINRSYGFIVYVAQCRRGLPVGPAIADRLLKLNPAIEVQDKRRRKDRGEPW